MLGIRVLVPGSLYDYMDISGYIMIHLSYQPFTTFGYHA